MLQNMYNFKLYGPIDLLYLMNIYNILIKMVLTIK